MTDYAKWAKFAAESDDEPSGYTPAQRAAAEAAARAAPAPAPADDGRSEIDKLKAARRLAREAAAATAPAASASSAAPAAPAPAPVDSAPADPLSRLVAAEAALAALRGEADAVRASLAAGGDAEAVTALVARVVAAQGGVGALQAAVDEIAVGELEDEVVRDDARARRKALNRALEGELVPVWTALRSDALAAKKRVAA